MKRAGSAVRHALGRAGAVGLLVLTLACYFLANASVPEAHGDEVSLLNVPYRVVTYGDVRYPAWISHSFGMDKLRRYPPVPAFWLRTAFNYVFGFSARKNRVFSGFAILAAVGLVVWVAKRQLGLKRWEALVLGGILALAPNSVLAARSTRHEQEVLLLGILGAWGLPALWGSVADRRAQRAVWFLSGFFLSVAGASHPWGLVFPGVFVMLLVGELLGRGRSGMRIGPCLWRWGLGGAFLGVAPTIVSIAADPSAFVDYARWVTQVYAARDQELVRWLSGPGRTWSGLVHWLSPGLVARLNSLDCAAFYEVAPLVGSRFGHAFRAIFYLQLASIVMRAPRALAAPARRPPVAVRLAVLMALAFCGLTFAYLPNATYGLYASFHVPLAFVLWSLGGTPDAASATGVWRRVGVVVCLAHFGLLVTFNIARLHETWTLARRAEVRPVALDQEFHALREAAFRSGLDGETDEIYTSLESWIAGGRRQAGLLEVVTHGLRPIPTHAQGVVFKIVNMVFFLRYLGGELPEMHPNLAERVALLRDLLRPLRLSTLLIHPRDPGQSYAVFSRPGSGDGVLHLGLMSAAGTTWTAGCPATERDEGDGRQDRSIPLDPGIYALLLERAVGARGSVEVRLEDSEAAAVFSWGGTKSLGPFSLEDAIFEFAPLPLVFNVRGTGAHLRLIDDAGHAIRHRLLRLSSEATSPCDFSTPAVVPGRKGLPAAR